MRLLFVCTRNRLRSPTAEAVFDGRNGLETLGAGTHADAPVPVDGDLVRSADVILPMEATHRRWLQRRFGPLLRGKRVNVLGIPDRYRAMEPALVEILERRVRRLLGR